MLIKSSRYRARPFFVPVERDVDSPRASCRKEGEVFFCKGRTTSRTSPMKTVLVSRDTVPITFEKPDIAPGRCVLSILEVVDRL